MLDLLLYGSRCFPWIYTPLGIEPELGRVAKQTGEPKRHLRAHRPALTKQLSMEDLLPRAEVELAARDRHHLPPRDLALDVGIPVVLSRRTKVPAGSSSN